MNKKGGITVVTPVGESEAEEIGEGLGQGGVESAVLSSSSIANGLNLFFGRSTDEIFYRSIRLEAWGYQDDITRASTNIEDARSGITKLEALSESKCLSFNHSKSSLVVLGSYKSRREMEQKLGDNPILLYGKPMKVKRQEKYLGEEIKESLAESALATICKRKGIVTLAINDIVNVMKDRRSQVNGGLVTAIEIWESAVIPFLLNSGEMWIGLPKKALSFPYYFTT